MKKINILYIEGNLDHTIGGSHYCLLETVRHLDRSLFNPHVLFFQDNPLVPEFRKNCKVLLQTRKKGLVIREKWPRLHQLAAGRGIENLLLLFQKSVNFSMCFAWQVLRNMGLIRKNRIQIVHLNNGPNLNDWVLAAKLLRRRCISHVRGTFRHSRPRMERAMIPFYDALIPISHSVQDFVRSQSSRLPGLHLINDGIDVAAVSSRRTRSTKEARREFQPKADAPLVGVVNNIKEWKGQHVAVEAVRHLKRTYPDLVCVLVGNVSSSPHDQKYHAHLRELIRRWDLEENICFAGYRQDVVDILSALDLVMHTSIANEGFPRILLETMTLGRPLLVSAIGPAREMIDDGATGLLFRPGDGEELAQKMKMLLDDPRLARTFGARAREKVLREFDIHKNVRTTEKLYLQLLGA